MHIIIYFFLVGSALLGLLFYADANMEPRGPLAINNEFVGLPAPWHGPATQNLASTPAPAPDMSSDAVLAAAPPPAAKPAAVAAATTGTGQTAKAEIAPKKKKHVARKQTPREDDAPRYAWRSGGDVGPLGGLFGRF